MCWLVASIRLLGVVRADGVYSIVAFDLSVLGHQGAFTRVGDAGTAVQTTDYFGMAHFALCKSS